MLPDRILVPLDGSKSGEVVLLLLKRLALQEGSRIILARIVEPGPKDPGPGFAEESLLFAEEYLREIAADLAKSGLRAQTLVRSDRVGEGLARAARSERASLIALATHGRTASPDRPFGGVAEQLIRTSPVPVLAVPSISRCFLEGLDGGKAFRRILATTDGSNEADRIMPLAADVAQSCGGSVILLELVPPAGRRQRTADQEKAASAHLVTLARVFERRGIPVERMTGREAPVPGVLDAVRRRNVDLVAMSTHGGDRRCEAAVGSVTRAVLQQAGVPVLMTRTCPTPGRRGGRRNSATSRGR